MHEPYENRLNHKADFRVKYRFRKPEEGGRKTGEPAQGIRSNFSFIGESEMFMIWPEFEDSYGNVLLENDSPVPNCGTARMWIIKDEMRPSHYDRIKVGMKGYFIEGIITAECEVIEILDLKKNPTRKK